MAGKNHTGGAGIVVLGLLVLVGVLGGNDPQAPQAAPPLPASSPAPVSEAQAALEARNRLEAAVNNNMLQMVEPSAPSEGNPGSGPPHINIPNPNLPNPDLPGHHGHHCHRHWCF